MMPLSRRVHTCAYVQYKVTINGTYRDCRKKPETSLGTGMHNRAITVLHELWMCHGKQRHTHITLCNQVTI